jgi:cell filamentation protein
VNPYIDPDTGAFYNKLGIKDPDELHQVEYAVTDLRIAELLVKPIPGKFDLEHLKAVHTHIFQDLYEWAGQVRTLDFSKRDPADPNWKSPFAPAASINDVADVITSELQHAGYLKGMKQAEFTAELAATYVKLNYMHPFNEGNGRSTQTFLTLLARDAGYELNYGNVSKDEWNQAAARSMPQTHVRDPGFKRRPDVAPIHEAFAKIVEPQRTRVREPDRDLER